MTEVNNNVNSRADSSDDALDIDREYTVSDWHDIDSIPELETREKERIAHVLTDGDCDVVMWIPQWVYESEETEIETFSATQQLLTGTITDYSDDAWGVVQSGRSFFIPKSESYVFRSGDSDIDSPQQKLGGFE